MTNSTPTTEDRNRDKKELETKITALKSVKDTAERETKLAVESADKARETLRETEKALSDVLAIIPSVSRETAEFIAHCEALMRDSGLKVKEMASMATSLHDSALKATETLEKTKKDAGAVHDTIVAETAVLQRKREDLDIYHGRLKEYFKKYLPEQKIII